MESIKEITLEFDWNKSCVKLPYIPRSLEELQEAAQQMQPRAKMQFFYYSPKTKSKVELLTSQILLRAYYKFSNLTIFARNLNLPSSSDRLCVIGLSQELTFDPIPPNLDDLVNKIQNHAPDLGSWEKQ